MEKPSNLVKGFLNSEVVCHPSNCQTDPCQSDEHRCFLQAHKYFLDRWRLPHWRPFYNIIHFGAKNSLNTRAILRVMGSRPHMVPDPWRTLRQVVFALSQKAITFSWRDHNDLPDCWSGTRALTQIRHLPQVSFYPMQALTHPRYLSLSRPGIFHLCG